jgi:nicotinamidase-related amidase
MRTAYEHGFEVITLTDCTAATSVKEHRHALKFDFPMFSKPMPSIELLGSFGS